MDKPNASSKLQTADKKYIEKETKIIAKETVPENKTKNANEREAPLHLKRFLYPFRQRGYPCFLRKRSIINILYSMLKCGLLSASLATSVNCKIKQLNSPLGYTLV